MQTTFPVALSAQLATERRLETIADNLANARTAGFRAEEVKFDSILSTAAQRPVAFVSGGERFVSTKAGELTQTGNALDLAVSGDAFFSFQGPNGPVLTRDGRVQMLDTGELVTVNGDPFLDVGGAPLLLDPAGGPPQVARDGMITQNGVQVGAVGLFALAPGTQLTRAGTSGFVPDRAPVPVVEFADNSVMQGFTEGSNVNPILEMTRLIEVQRTFEMAASMVQTSEGSLASAIAALGSNK